MSNEVTNFKKMELETLIGTIVASLVDNVDDVRIGINKGERSIHINVYCSPDDIGKVIGKSGRTAENIRALARNIASRDDRRVTVTIVD